MPVPVCRRAESLVRSRCQLLQRIAAIFSVELPHDVAVDHMDDSTFAGHDQDMRMRTGLIGKQDNASETQIFVVSIQAVLVVGSEVIEQVELARFPSQFQNAVAVVSAVVRRIESSIACG